jgi:putative transposase
MPRPPRLEFPGAHYHVINRGNYRADVFLDTGTRAAFVDALQEAATKQGWRVHAWAVMRNHYHLALETPRANLVEGMQWLQGTFAMRFNYRRDERGHLFQGRYKSLLVEPGDHLGALCHYIHLNPVRAGVCSIEDLASWRWTSLHWMMNPVRRPEWYDPEPALREAGGCTDSPEGRRQYVAYLGWMQESEAARRDARFDEMSKGWCFGSPPFRGELLERHRELAQRGGPGTLESGAARAATLLQGLLNQLGRTADDLRTDSKSAPWKIALAASLRQRVIVSNRWLGEHLHLGSLHHVSRTLNAWERRSRPPTTPPSDDEPPDTVTPGSTTKHKA